MMALNLQPERASEPEPPAKAPIIDFVREYSIETTPAESARRASYRDELRPGTRVYVTAIDGRPFAESVATARRLRDEGLVPVPHITARSIKDRRDLDARLQALAQEAGADEALVIAGDLIEPAGAYDSSIQLLETGLFERHGFRRIGLAGHPEGSRMIGEARLAEALRQKNAFAERTDMALHLVTQFAFEAAPIIAWDKAIRRLGNRLPIHVGIPGPATLKNLLNYARLCGIGASTRALTRQAAGITRLLTVWQPGEVVAALARYKAEDPECGIVQPHLYPLGGLSRAVRWIEALRAGEFVLKDGAPEVTVLTS
jgi:methylenetetrahydrofolate reductase (NADPH)